MIIVYRRNILFSQCRFSDSAYVSFCLGLPFYLYFLRLNDNRFLYNNVIKLLFLLTSLCLYASLFIIVVAWKCHFFMTTIARYKLFCRSVYVKLRVCCFHASRFILMISLLLIFTSLPYELVETT